MLYQSPLETSNIRSRVPIVATNIAVINWGSLLGFPHEWGDASNVGQYLVASVSIQSDFPVYGEANIENLLDEISMVFIQSDFPACGEQNLFWTSFLTTLFPFSLVSPLMGRKFERQVQDPNGSNVSIQSDFPVDGEFHFYFYVATEPEVSIQSDFPFDGESSRREPCLARIPGGKSTQLFFILNKVQIFAIST
jgi:hypothetical protein